MDAISTDSYAIIELGMVDDIRDKGKQPPAHAGKAAGLFL
jgi:hypothetical protein